MKRSRKSAKARLTASGSQAVCVKFRVTKRFKGVPFFSASRIAGLMLVICCRRMKLLRRKDYPSGESMVPHGMSVSLTAPEAFRFTFQASPERHLRAASLLAPDLARTDDPAEQLPAALLALMRDIGIPNGIGGVGYGKSDVDDLVEGTMKQQRILAVAPRDVTEDDVARIFIGSIELW